MEKKKRKQNSASKCSADTVKGSFYMRRINNKMANTCLCQYVLKMSQSLQLLIRKSMKRHQVRGETYH